MVVFAGWTTGITAIFHPMGRKVQARIIYVVVSIILVLLGESLIVLGKVEYLRFFDSAIHFRVIGSLIVIRSWLFNIDKNMAQ